MKNYYLGLDIGTNSVGWAVCDENYNLIRKKGKDLWGVRLFKEGETAEDRRIQRSSRRRYGRRRARLQYLRELFEPEINKVDNKFYERLAESKFYLEDKKIPSKYSLFDSDDYTDKDYYNEFPTIFHLRLALMESKSKKDIRFYFLAINQMMKRRGHFLFEGQKIDKINDVSSYIENFEVLIREIAGLEDIDRDLINEIIEVFCDKDLKKIEKKIKLKDLISSQEYEKKAEKIFINIVNSVISEKIKFKDIFVGEENEFLLEKLEENKEITLRGEKYEEAYPIIEPLLEDKIQFIEIIKSIYDYSILQSILGGDDSISASQVNRYEKHKNDLAKLKKLLLKYDKNVYERVFKGTETSDSYAKYLGYYKNRNKKITLKKSTREVFLKELKKTLDALCDKNDKDYLDIISDIEKENFLLKQIVSTNSTIPYQLHLMELTKILENMGKYYPSFLEKDKNGIDTIEKIRMIFTFRIPYYVGPLNDSHKNQKNSNTWIIKNTAYENEKIRPWNFEKLVDLDACEEEFIQRMTNMCSYLKSEKVIPKKSLLYSEFMVLNELNNLKINGEKLSSENKLKVYNGLFKTYKTVSLAKLKDYLASINLIDKKDEINFSGVDFPFKASLSSYISFEKILGNKFDYEMVEDIIYQLTVHGSAGHSLKSKFKEKYPVLSDKDLNKIVNMKFTDWSRLSSKFLCGIEGFCKQTGEKASIIEFMRERSENLMEILSDRYSFLEEINLLDKTIEVDKIKYSLIEDSYASPAVKKMIWQALKITDEISKVLKQKPRKIFIEMPRIKEDKPQKKDSRKARLTSAYKALGKEYKDWVKELDARDESSLRQKKLYLYYTQNGRCMYSGEKIQLSELYDNNLYDIDHIIPQSLKKDDSINNNLVLVKKNLNQSVKKDVYPIPDEIRKTSEIKKLWKFLLDSNLISKIKYDRLIRNTQLTDSELADFINRQLVETSQSTKLIANILENVYKESKIVYVKASLASDFRKQYEILKARDLNDLHHAHDAYLNIVIGNIYNIKFTDNPLNFVKEKRGNYTVNMKSILKNDVFDRNKKNIWDAKQSISHIKNTIFKPSVLFTVEPYEQRGALFQATISGKNDYKKSTKYLPLKKDERLKDISKYGGYLNIKSAYCFLVESDGKKGKLRTIEFCPIYLAKEIKENKSLLTEYCKQDLGLKNPVVLIPKILYKTLIKLNGFYYTINGATSGRLALQPSVQAHWSSKEYEILRKIIQIKEKSEMYGEGVYDNLTDDEVSNALEIVLKKINSKAFRDRLNLIEMVVNYEYIKCDFQKKQKIDFTLELLKYVKARREKINLKAIGGKGESGMTSMSSKIMDGKSELKELKLLYQSITGIYEKEVDLLK